MLKARTRAEFQQTFRLIYSKDPAVNKAEFMRIEKYLKSWEIADIAPALRDGCEPTYFICRQISANAVLVCDGQVTVEFRNWWAFRYGFDSIVGLEFTEKWEPAFDDSDAGKILKGGCTGDLAERIGMDVIQEIGEGILARAHLTVPEKKGSAPQPGSDRTA